MECREPLETLVRFARAEAFEIQNAVFFYFQNAGHSSSKRSSTHTEGTVRPPGTFPAISASSTFRMLWAALFPAPERKRVPRFAGVVHHSLEELCYRPNSTHTQTSLYPWIQPTVVSTLILPPSCSVQSWVKLCFFVSFFVHLPQSPGFCISIFEPSIASCTFHHHPSSSLDPPSQYPHLVTLGWQDSTLCYFLSISFSHSIAADKRSSRSKSYTSLSLSVFM